MDNEFDIKMGLGIWTAINAILYSISKVATFKTETLPLRPPAKVSIIIPAWKEPKEFVMTTLRSLRGQTIVRAYPKMFEFIFVDGVDYIDEVRPYVHRILHAPKGKLKARDAGIKEASGDIIVSVDADTFYPPNWLNLMLRPFHESGVVGTTTTKDFGVYDVVGAQIIKLLYYSNIMLGRGSAFWKWAYFKVGGFDVSKDSADVETIWREEELNFMQKLKRVGKVVLVDAPVIHLGEEAPWKMKEGRGLRALD